MNVSLINAYMSKYGLTGKDWYICIETLLKSKKGERNE